MFKTKTNPAFRLSTCQYVTWVAAAGHHQAAVLVGLAFLLLSVVAPVASAATVYIPDDYATIQEAIDDPSLPDGSVIRVRPDSENSPPGPYASVRFYGRPLTIESIEGPNKTTIQGRVTFWNDETRQSVLRGFTIRPGSGDAVRFALSSSYFASGTLTDCVIENAGVGVEVKGQGDPILSRLVIRNCGQGMRLEDTSTAVVSDCEFLDNGTGIDIYDDSKPDIVRCFFVDNTSTGIDIDTPMNPQIRNCSLLRCGAEGISVESDATATLTNITIADSGDRGIQVLQDATATIRNVIVTGSADYGIYGSTGSMVTLSHSNFWDNDGSNYGGTVSSSSCDQCKSEDPKYRNLFEGDLHLDSSSGCIDEGYPALSDGQFPPGQGQNRSDMGAFGGPENQWQSNLVCNGLPQPDGETPPFQSGEEVDFQLAFINHGFQDTGEIGIGYFLGTSPTDLSDLRCTDYVPGISPGQGRVASCQLTFTPEDVGTRYLIVWIDHPATIDEITKGDNICGVYGPFEVVPSFVEGLRHLGDDDFPSGSCEPQSPEGVSHTYSFELTSSEFQDYASSGAEIEFRYAEVDGANSLAMRFNGDLLGYVPVSSGCTTAPTYRVPVTSRLSVGLNEFEVRTEGGGDLDEVLVGDFQLVTGGPPLAVSIVVTTNLDEVRFETSFGGSPFDDVRIQVLEGSQEVESGVPEDGVLTFSISEPGIYDYKVTQLFDDGAVIEESQFEISFDNLLPQIVAAEAQPAVVVNDGSSSVEFIVDVTDPDGTIESVRLDLRQLGGSAAEQMSFDGSDYHLTHPISSSIPVSSYSVPATAIDDRGGSATAGIALSVTSPGGSGDSIGPVAGFTVSGDLIEDLGGGRHRVSGNVLISHNLGLQLLLEARGGVEVDLGSASIESEGTVSLRADLGLLGVQELFDGEFSLSAAGLSVDQAAEYALDEIQGFVMETTGMGVDVVLDPPGIAVSAAVDLASVPGVSSDAPIEVAVNLNSDGTVSGGFAASNVTLEIPAGEISVEASDWSDDTWALSNVQIQLDANLFDNAVPPLSVAMVEMTAEGIDVDGVEIGEFEFAYAGFSFAATRSVLSRSGFLVEEASLALELPGGDYAAEFGNLTLADGELHLDSGGISIPPLDIGGFSTGGVSASFASENGQFTLKAEADLDVPQLASIPISFRLNSDCTYIVQEFCMSLEFRQRGIPIGNTGLFLTQAGGCVIDPECGNDWEFLFLATVASGARIADEALLSGEVEVTIITSDPALLADGSVYVIGNPLAAAGFAVYPNSLHAYGGITFPPTLEFLRAQANLDVHWANNQFTVVGTSNGQLVIGEEYIPRWSDDVVLADFSSRIDNEGFMGQLDLPNSERPIVHVLVYLGWDRTYEFDLDFEWPWWFLDSESGDRFGIRDYRRVPVYISTDGAPTLIGNDHSMPAGTIYHGDTMEAGAFLPRRNQQEWSVGVLDGYTIAFQDTVSTVPVPADSGPIVIHLEELSESGDPELSLVLITPSGVEVDSAYCETTEGFAYGRAADDIYYRVESPEEGVWLQVISDIDEDETYVLEAFLANQPPDLDALEPSTDASGTTADSFPISWLGVDPTGDVLDYRVLAIREAASAADSVGLGPWVIAELSADSSGTTVWLPREYQSGDYRIIVEATDGFHTVADTCAGIISLQNLDLPGQTTGFDVNVGPRKLRLLWDRADEPDVRGYEVIWQHADSARVDTVDAGAVTQHVISGLSDYENYNVSTRPYDVDGNKGPLSNVEVSSPTPLGDADPPPTPDGLTAAWDSVTGELSVSWQASLDAVGYRVHYDIDVVGPYTSEDASEGSSPITQGRVESIILNGLRTGRQYYIAVSAFDDLGNESLLTSPVPVVITDTNDVDADGLPDDLEVEAFGDLSYDSSDDPDGDLLDNGDEVAHGTHMARFDTDSDQVADGPDINPLTTVDADGDGMPDDWELHYSATGDLDPDADEDGDLLSNRREYVERAYPQDADSDDDLLGDGFEVDSLGTDAWNPDTDLGGEWDGSEFANGRDPLDPGDDMAPPANAPGDVEAPTQTRLFAARPNPFSGQTSISFDLVSNSKVSLTVFDVSGRVVTKLVDREVLEAGRHVVDWKGEDSLGRPLPSGVYFHVLEAGDFVARGQVILTR